MTLPSKPQAGGHQGTGINQEAKALRWQLLDSPLLHLQIRFTDPLPFHRLKTFIYT